MYYIFVQSDNLAQRENYHSLDKMSQIYLNHLCIQALSNTISNTSTQQAYKQVEMTILIFLKEIKLISGGSKEDKKDKNVLKFETNTVCNLRPKTFSV